MSEPAASNQRPARFGPFFRVESPTQTEEDSRRQGETGEIWGQTPRGGSWPQVKAYRGMLPPSTKGIEFWTNVAPDESGPVSRVSWSGGGFNNGVRTDGEFAKITCVITKNTQVSE